MAVSRKAMTEGIRTPTFLGTLNKAQFDNPSVKNQRFLPAPFTQGSLGCSRTSTFINLSQKNQRIVSQFSLCATIWFLTD